MRYYMGIDIGGTKIAYGLFDEQRKLIKKERASSDDQKSAEVFWGEIADQILAFRNEVKEQGDELCGVGIGVPGFVEFETGFLSKVPSLPNLSGFGAAEFLHQRIGNSLKIVIDNDGHYGALAEYRQGAGKGHRSMLYCPVSTGISTGMVLDGRLFRGSNGASGESGHMLTCVPESEQMECMCGNSGCFNSLGSGKAIPKYVQKWIAEGEKTILTELAGNADAITTKHINEAYDLGDEIAIRAVDQMAHYLAVWIFNVYMLLNVDCIVFSGGLLQMGDKLSGRIKEEFERYHTNGFPVYFYHTMLGDDSGLVGAMELILE